MKSKDFDRLSQHAELFRSRRSTATTILAFFAVVVLTSTYFIFVDRGFSAWMPDGEIVVMALGFLILSRFYSQRNRYQSKYGQKAFQTAFINFTIPGLSIILAAIAHIGYMPGPELPEVWWKNIIIAIGYFLVILGAVLWIRSVAALGVDNLSMLYVYLPAESRFVDSGIYSTLRHPIYAAALYIGIGLALAHANWYSFVVSLILPIFLTGWISLVEEKELIQRFPDYIEYRNEVPAFWVKPNSIFKFYEILMG